MATRGKRLIRKIDVRDWLVINGPATMHQVMRGTGLTAAAVSHAMQDIRNDPTLEYTTVPTYKDGYAYKIAYTVEQMRNGLRNQALHMRTRAESWITAGEKAMAIAATPDDYALAADIKANGKMLKAQAEAILSAIGAP